MKINAVGRTEGGKKEREIFGGYLLECTSRCDRVGVGKWRICHVADIARAQSPGRKTKTTSSRR